MYFAEKNKLKAIENLVLYHTLDFVSIMMMPNKETEEHSMRDLCIEAGLAKRDKVLELDYAFKKALNSDELRKEATDAEIYETYSMWIAGINPLKENKVQEAEEQVKEKMKRYVS